ncbi:MAG TPA: glycoside hydrolase family 76 protein [Candidatus Xenobia bacterium]|jgi:hypothetical protein
MLSAITGTFRHIAHAFSTGYHDAVHYGSEGVKVLKGGPHVVEHLAETYVNSLVDPHPGPDKGELSSEAEEALTHRAEGNHPEARAKLSFNAAARYMGEPGDMHDNDHSWKATSCWALSQAMAASLDQAKLTGNYSNFHKLDDQLQKYKNLSGHGYAADTDGATGFGGSWYDDNSWVGLDYMQAYHQTHDKKYLTAAQQQFDFIRHGMYKGGMMWDSQQQPGSNTSPPSWNTCTEGPAAELALRLHTATNPKGTNDPYLQMAHQLNDNMNKYLRRPDGLYNDHVAADHPTQHKAGDDGLLAYNQGTPIGVNTLLYRITGKREYLQAAQQTAHSSLPKVQQWGLSESPEWDGIYFRNLMQLDAVAPDPSYRAALQKYNNQAWHDGRHPATDLFGNHGMGNDDSVPSGSQYDLIDQMGLVQTYSLQAMPASDYSAVS